MNCYRHIKDYLDSLIELLKDLNATKELHSYYKNEFQSANDLERANFLLECW